MGKGGGGGTQVVKQENIPEYARPYFENILQRGQALSYQDYTPYGGQRIAGFTPGQITAQQETLGMSTPGQFGQASQFASAAGAGSLAAGQYSPAQIQNIMAQAPDLQQYQMGPAQDVQGAQVRTDSFTAPGAAQQFMSPYMQNVVDIQKQEAIRDAQKANLAGNLAAARQGTYGGARKLLAQTERERYLADQMAEIQATGSQAAFQAAQQGFEQEQARRLQAQLANQQSFLEAQRLTEQSRQFGSGQQMQGLSQLLQSGQLLGQLGSAQQAADLDRIKAQSAAGAEQQALYPQQLDIAYADFLRQRDYEMEQLGYYSNLLRGLPVGLNSTQTTYAPPPSAISQLAGLGTAYAGFSGLGKKRGGLVELGLQKMMNENKGKD